MPEGLALEILQEGEPVRTVDLPADGLTIGRDPTCGVVLAHRAVSRQHARIVVKGDEVSVLDLGSSQGTYVDGARVDSAPLRPGMAIAIGPYAVKLVKKASDARATGGAKVTPGSLDIVGPLGRLTDLVGVSDLQAVLETLLERVTTLFSAKKGFVVLVQKGNLSPILAAHGGSTTDATFSQTVCTDAASGKRPLLLAGEDDFSRFSGSESLVVSKAQCVVAVPLVDDDEALGVLYVESDRVVPLILSDPDRLLGSLSSLGGRALRAAIERRQIVTSHERWRWLATAEGEAIDPFAGAQSPRMTKILDLIKRVSREDMTVLITGESGTGKEVVARAVHTSSRRRDQPFVAVNCGAVPRELMESEFFGHERGAFTGATARKIGRFDLAQGGTLLLDEVGDLPKELQVKLLRVLEARTFERVGSTETLRWDGRVLAATNRDLKAAAARGEFREDLYYRLAVFTVELPPLRERLEDIGALAESIIIQTNRRFARKIYGMTPEAVAALSGYHWPGNVRELRNVIERAFVLESEDLITPASLLLPQPAQRPAAASASSPDLPSGEVELPSLNDYLARQEAHFIRFVLERAGGNVSQAARMLKIGRSALHRKLRAMGLRGLGAEEPDDDEHP